VERRGQGQYEISYQPTIKGRHQLHVKAQGQHIRRSPFIVAVQSPVGKLGSPILTMGGVEIPWGVTICIWFKWGEASILVLAQEGLSVLVA
jgi:hypothetical protein